MKRNKHILSSAIILLCINIYSQDSKYLFQDAFRSIDSMLTGKSQIDFERAVFLTENAYLEGKLDYSYINNELVILKNLTEVVSQSSLIDYNKRDKELVTKSAALFKVMTDTIPIVLDENRVYIHIPFSYDYEDIWGNNDYSKNFVSKLITTKKGNCHSLPFLFKIIADEFNLPAYLSMAPNHIYIKQYCKGTGWYNTELTSSSFPIDSWLMASGYIHLDAIRNGLYMDTLSIQQSVAFTLIDLAKGYEHKYGISNPEFIFNCIDNAIKYIPNNVNALLYGAESKKRFIELQMEIQNVAEPSELFPNPEIKQTFNEMEQTYKQLHHLGYRRMPDEMYSKWLTMLKSNPEKYTDKKVINKFETK